MYVRFEYINTVTCIIVYHVFGNEVTYRLKKRRGKTGENAPPVIESPLVHA